MSKIEWTDTTWNPVTGCDRCSPGCDNCYALTMAGRLKLMDSAKYQNDGDPRTSGPGFKVTCHPETLDEPLRWRKPRRVFVNSMSDLFHPDVPDEFILDVFTVMARAGRHTFQVLTKRPQRMAQLVDRIAWRDCRYPAGGPFGSDDSLMDVDMSGATAYLIDVGETPLENVWLGTSIESNRYTFRADHLRDTPAAVRFLSLEPLLGSLPSLDLTGIDWVIVGGESGPNARPMHPDWVRMLRDRCMKAGVPFFFKQWGEWCPRRWVGDPAPCRDLDGVEMYRAGKSQAGRRLDGHLWDEYPEVAS